MSASTPTSASLDRSTLRWAFAQAWRCSPALLLLLGLATLARGVVPAVQTLVARGLIDATLAQVQSADPQLEPLLPWFAVGLPAMALEAALGVVFIYLHARLTDEVNLHLTSRVLERADRHDLSFFDDPANQDTLERVQDRLAERFGQFLESAFDLGTSLLQIGGLSLVLLLVEPWTLLALSLLVLPYVFFQSRLAKLSFRIEEGRIQRRRWTRYFVGQLTRQPSVSEIKLLAAGPLLLRRFRSFLGDFRDQDRSLYRRSLMGSSAFALTSTFVFFALWVRVVVRALEGAASLGDVAIFAAATGRLRLSVEQGSGGVKELLENGLHLQVLRDFLGADEATSTTAQSRTTPSSKGGSRIAFQGADFRYPGSETLALHDIDLIVEPRETLALVGENGSGKSTLVKLMAGLYAPERGEVLVDGKALTERGRRDWQSNVGFVFQDFSRFEASVHENIAMGDWQELLDDPETVASIARQAGLEELVERLPSGMATRLGPHFGERQLSDGQWQQLAIARALARRAQLLILDEPTASLDVRAERRLFDQFKELARDRTTVLISHRFSTVALADRIAVLERGRLVEIGRHEELIERAGLYAELYRLHREAEPPSELTPA